jgi:hypothetical protein
MGKPGASWFGWGRPGEGQAALFDQHIGEWRTRMGFLVFSLAKTESSSGLKE